MNQGLKYFSNIKKYAETYTDPSAFAENLKIIKKILSKINNKQISSICDIGCGAAENLVFLNNYFKANKPLCYGVEPSNGSIKSLRERLRNTKIKFKKDSIHNLQSKNNQYDLVICWSVLHWIDRDLYLQSIGELIRVSKKYLIIMDFCPKKSFKNIYKHKKELYTFKVDFDVPFIQSGILEKKYEMYFYYDSKIKKIFI